MEFGWTADLEEFRGEVRRFIAEHGGYGESRATVDLEAVRRDLERENWLRISWPVEDGGEGRSSWYQFILATEFAHADLPFGLGVTAMILPAIMRFGTLEQKRIYMTGLWDGTISCALGYSEPNAGTDLASLETTAVRDGDDWVINGQKLWTSTAHTATHVWLAVRTDPTVPKHRGISMFMVPLSVPGITVRPIYTMSGDRTNETFFEDVRVPGNALIGEPGQGWYIAAHALDYERVTVGTYVYVELVRLMEAFLDYVDPASLSPVGRLRLAEMARDLHVGRALNLTNAAIIADGGTPTMEASMAKVWMSELRYKMSSVFMDLVGDRSRLSAGEGSTAPIGGLLEQTYRVSPRSRFAGGTNEVQRSIIAQRGLGLPR